MKNKIKQGFSIHCHHDILAEYCYDYDERVAYIKSDKPKNEIETRLKLFKILPKKALKETPIAWQEADKARREAYKAWREADKAWQEADKARKEAYKAWSQKQKDAFHKKWCGCKEWNGKELVFEK